MFGKRVYSYIKFTIANFRRMRDAMQRGENFKPSDYGEVIEAGQGEPDAALKLRMKQLYGVESLPTPSNSPTSSQIPPDDARTPPTVVPPPPPPEVRSGQADRKALVSDLSVGELGEALQTVGTILRNGGVKSDE